MKQPKSFEEGLTRLQELLTALQDESTPLAQSVKLLCRGGGTYQLLQADAGRGQAADQ